MNKAELITKMAQESGLSKKTTEIAVNYPPLIEVGACKL